MSPGRKKESNQQKATKSLIRGERCPLSLSVLSEKGVSVGMGPGIQLNAVWLERQVYWKTVRSFSLRPPIWSMSTE